MGYIITFVGNDGAGKSTLLTNIACALVNPEVTVGVLSTDLRYQQLPVMLAGATIKQGMSLGTLFNRDSLVDTFAEYPPVHNLFVAGPVRGESCMEHEPPDRKELERFMFILNNTFDYVLIEANQLMFNQFSAVAVRFCNMLINVVEATEMGISYDLSNYGLLESFRPDMAPLNILNGDDGDVSAADAQKRLGHPFHYVMPYHKLVRRSATRCMPVYIDKEAASGGIAGYKKKIKTISDEIVDAYAEAEMEQRRRAAIAKKQQQAKRKRIAPKPNPQQLPQNRR